MIATQYKMGVGTGSDISRLVSFDKALIEAGVGNYNLVRLSSILPAKCKRAEKISIPEGSLLPTAYSTISSDVAGEVLVSTIGIGFPYDEDKVGVIMEYSAKNVTEAEALQTLDEMIANAFEYRGWRLKGIKSVSISEVVPENETLTTFACVAEW